MASKETLGNRIKKARQDAGMTLQEVGVQIGRTAGAVSAWERDVNPPLTDNLKRLADVLKVSYSWLVIGEEYSERHLTEKRDGVRYVPVLEWSQLDRLSHYLSPRQIMDAPRKTDTVVNVGQRAFSLVVPGDALEPLHLCEGYVLTIDPDAPPKHKSIVLVKLAPDLPWTLRMLTTDSGRKRLKLSRELSEIMNDKTQIIGVLREARKEFD